MREIVINETTINDQSECYIIAELGHKLPSLIADNMDKGFITYSDALNYLSINTRYFEKVIKRTLK